MSFFSNLFGKKKVNGINGLFDFNSKSASISAALVQTFSSHFNGIVNQILDECKNNEAKNALALYANVITQTRIINSVCSDRTEKMQNNIEKVAGLSAACVVAQQRILISYMKISTDNIYTSKIQAFVDSQMKDCNKDLMSVEQMSQDLGLKSYMVFQADSLCDVLSEERTKQYIDTRIDTIMTDRQL